MTRHQRAAEWIAAHDAPESALCWYAADVRTVAEVPEDALDELADACRRWRDGQLAHNLFKPEDAILEPGWRRKTWRRIEALRLRRTLGRSAARAEEMLIEQPCGHTPLGSAQREAVTLTVTLAETGAITWSEDNRRWEPATLVPQPGRVALRLGTADPLDAVRNLPAEHVAAWVRNDGTLTTLADGLVAAPHRGDARAALRRQVAVAVDRGLLTAEQAREAEG